MFERMKSKFNFGKGVSLENVQFGDNNVMNVTGNTTRIRKTSGNITLVDGKVLLNGQTVEVDGDRIPAVYKITIETEGNEKTTKYVECDTFKFVVHGDCESIDTMSGDVFVDGDAQLIDTVSGSITVHGDVHGNCETVSGRISANSITGNCKTVSGSISKNKR